MNLILSLKISLRIFIFCITILFFPIVSSAQVVLSEIMYDVSGTDTGREWVEVFNGGNGSVDLKSWKLSEDDKNHNAFVASQGGSVVPTQGYAIIADNPAKFLTDWPGFSGIIFDATFSLGNGGGKITLKNDVGSDMDTANFNSGMGAGGNGNSLQKASSGWISAAPTPGASNASVDTEAKVEENPPANNGTSSNQTASTTATTTVTTTQTISDSSSGGGSYVYSSYASLSTYDAVSLNVDAGRERIAFLHTPLQFKSKAVDKNSGKDVSGARFSWTFGDGASLDGSSVSHTYAFPGEYMAVLNSTSGSDDAVDITKIKVLEPKAEVRYTDAYLEFTNQSAIDLNIGGWKVKGKNREYIIPRDTIILGKGSIKILKETLGQTGSGKITILYPDGQIFTEISILTNEDTQKVVAELSAKLAVLKYKLSQAYNVSEVGDKDIPRETGSRLISEKDIDRKNIILENEDGVVSAASPVEAEASKSLVSKVIDFFGMMFR